MMIGMTFGNLAFNLSGAIALVYLATGPALESSVERAPTEPVVSAVAAGFPPSDTGPETAATHVARADDGLFYVWGEVNGTKVRFLVDTGASVTVLTKQDAQRAGVEIDHEHRGTRLRTASGSAEMQWVQLDRVRVAGKELNDLDAAVMSDGPAVSLLGQNLLTRLGTVAIDGNQLRLR